MPRAPRTHARDTQAVLDMAHAITGHASAALSQSDFARGVLELVCEFTGADVAGLWLRDHYRFRRYVVSAEPPSFRVREAIRADIPPDRLDTSTDEEALPVVRLGYRVLEADAVHPGGGVGDSFWSADVRSLSAAELADEGGGSPDWASTRGLVLIPLPLEQGDRGLLKLKWWAPDQLSREDVSLFESIAGLCASSLTLHASRLALRERMKEMSCLYRISQVVNHPDITVPAAMTGIAQILPEAWQYPEIASARIDLDQGVFETSGYAEIGPRQSAEIARRGLRRGQVTVGYREERPLQDEGPFLREERTLIDGVAREIGLIVERIESREHEARLQEQLRHADRLATIGQLAAGVAHELNEPIASILGYSQLALKSPGVPEQARDDLKKVVRSSLDARDIIRNLLAFARQEPARDDEIEPGEFARDLLAFFAPRWGRKRITVVQEISDRLPVLRADAAQLRQVFVNLLLNAVQAMPEGGTLTVRVGQAAAGLRLQVVDTGSGMSEEVRRRAFDPFFTTKDVNEGTGLGLAVVHGIVAGHGGHIEIESAPGAGSTFTVEIPWLGASDLAAAGDREPTR